MGVGYPSRTAQEGTMSTRTRPAIDDDLRPILAPFTIIIDTREQAPFEFQDIRGDARDGYRPVHVSTVTRGLRSGDYSIAGLEDRIAIERKSHSDLFSTLGRGRERFEAELERLNEMDFAAIVIESGWREIAYYPPERSQMSSKCVMRSIFAYSIRFPRCHWYPMGSRRFAEATCFRLLERFWKDAQKQAAVA
jgi:ERCC4-type nuclease